jgi:hypothetical protein
MKPIRLPTTVFARVTSVFVTASVRLSLGRALCSVRFLPAWTGRAVHSV